MTPAEIHHYLTERLGAVVQTLDSGSYQVDLDQVRLLVLLLEEQSWLTVLVPIAPAANAQEFWVELLEANFEQTQVVRYALHQDVLWGVFQHRLASLTPEDFAIALQQLLQLHAQGLDGCFNQLVEKRIRQIIQVSKQQGLSLESTMQTLERFYQEGLMGDLSASADERNVVLAAWRRRLEELWQEET
jgi:hypothetical protein